MHSRNKIYAYCIYAHIYAIELFCMFCIFLHIFKFCFTGVSVAWGAHLIFLNDQNRPIGTLIYRSPSKCMFEYVHILTECPTHLPPFKAWVNRCALYRPRDTHWSIRHLICIQQKAVEAKNRYFILKYTYISSLHTYRKSLISPHPLKWSVIPALTSSKTVLKMHTIVNWFQIRWFLPHKPLLFTIYAWF